MPIWDFKRYDCFNPRSHKGATIENTDRYEDFWVSIHAPIRERRTRIRSETMYLGFNPRSHKGATWAQLVFQSQTSGFNPRSHKGATCYDTARLRAYISFNPRSHKGATQ